MITTTTITTTTRRVVAATTHRELRLARQQHAQPRHVRLGVAVVVHEVERHGVVVAAVGRAAVRDVDAEDLTV